MNINRESLRSLKQDRALKKSYGNTDINKEIDNIIPIIENHIKQSTVEKAANWMLSTDLWLQNESGHLKSNIEYRNYTRGSIIMSVEWGTENIGTEIRYPHPAVVLYDQGEDWVIAAPITAAKIDQKTKQPVAHPPFEVIAFKQNNKPEEDTEYWFKKHSVIQVDQIQRISKYRALNKNSYKLKENLLNQIENIILEFYLPGKHYLIENLKTALIGKNEELSVAKMEIEKLKAELENIKKK